MTFSNQGGFLGGGDVRAGPGNQECYSCVGGVYIDNSTVTSDPQGKSCAGALRVNVCCLYSENLALGH